MKIYRKPAVSTEKSFETNALACGKTTDPPPGSWHSSIYDTWTGHLGPGFGVSESESGTISAGWIAGSTSYPYSGLCSNWISFHS